MGTPPVTGESLTCFLSVWLEVTVADVAIAFASFRHTVTAAVAVGRLATGDTGAVVCTTVAVFARIADIIVIAGGLAGRVAAAVAVVAVGGAVAVIVVAIGAADFRILVRCTGDYFDTLAVVRAALPFTGRLVVAYRLGSDARADNCALAIRIVGVGITITVVIDAVGAGYITFRTFDARCTRCAGVRFAAT